VCVDPFLTFSFVIRFCLFLFRVASRPGAGRCVYVCLCLRLENGVDTTDQKTLPKSSSSFCFKSELGLESSDTGGECSLSSVIFEFVGSTEVISKSE
jgi:hypothetical protein